MPDRNLPPGVSIEEVHPNAPAPDIVTPDPGSDDAAGETSLSRTTMLIEEGIKRATEWAVFEPNDEPLWAKLRIHLGVFMSDLFRQGLFPGLSSQDAYFVRCDSETTTQYDRDCGVVNIVVGFALLKPAEFTVIKVQVKTAPSST
jgi:uncharacterized protein